MSQNDMDDAEFEAGINGIANFGIQDASKIFLSSKQI